MATIFDLAGSPLAALLPVTDPMNNVNQTPKMKTGWGDYICSSLLLVVMLWCLSLWHSYFFERSIEPDIESALTRQIAFRWFATPIGLIILLLLLWRTRALASGGAIGLSAATLAQLFLIAVAGALFQDKAAVALVWVPLAYTFLGVIALVAAYFHLRSGIWIPKVLFLIALVASYTYAYKIIGIFVHSPDKLHMAAPHEAFPNANQPVSSLNLLNTCLWYYHQNSRTGFPSDIHEFHQTMECSGTEPIFGAHSQSFTFVYSPAAPDDTGRIEHYSVLLEYNSPYREYKYSFYTDDTGILHRGAQHATQTSPAVIWAGQDDLLRIIESLKKAQEQHLPFPVSVPQPPVFSAGINGVPRDIGYHVLYERGASGTTFTLQARPVEYGIGATRSYFVNQEMVIHATPGDRPPTASDAIAWKCEFYSGDQCHPFPWIVQRLQ